MTYYKYFAVHRIRLRVYGYESKDSEIKMDSYVFREIVTCFMRSATTSRI